MYRTEGTFLNFITVGYFLPPNLPKIKWVGCNNITYHAIKQATNLNDNPIRKSSDAAKVYGLGIIKCTDIWNHPIPHYL